MHGSKTIILATLVAIASSSEAKAADRPSPVELQWTAPRDCPTEDKIRAEIEDLLGRSLESPSNGAVSARGTVTEGKHGFTLRLSIGSGAEQRNRLVADTSCDRLGQAAALIVELAIEDAAGTESASSVPTVAPIETSPPADLPAPPRSSLPSAAERLPERASSQGRFVRLSVRASGGVDVLALPRAAPGFTVALAARRALFDVEGSFSYWAAERATLATGAGGDVWLMVGGVRGCISPLHSRFEIGGCAALEVGTMNAEGFGVEHPGEGSALWVAPVVGLRGSYRLAGPLAAVADIDAAFPLIQRTFLLENVGDVYRPPGATPRFALGLKTDLW
jgi:hypothetical protein